MGQLLTKKSFSPQNELHTAKLCFSVVLKNFCRNSLKASLFIKKIAIPERSLEILRKITFPTILKMEKPEENLDLV